jgi:hypothetical protein
MHKAVRLGVLGVMSATVVAGTAVPAEAVTWEVLAHQSTPGYADAGATAKAVLSWSGRRTLTYTTFNVNDTCPGDGFRALGRAHAVYRDGSHGYGAWHIDSGCDGDGNTLYNLTFTGSKDIMKAGVQACVDLGDRNVCTSDFQDNPYTSY